MRLLSESGADEQYVGVVRKWLADPLCSFRRHFRAFLLLFLMSALLLMLAGVGLGLIVGLEFMSLLSHGVTAGLLLPMAGFYLFVAVRFSHGLRMDRLMVKYHDELKEELRGAHETQESAADNWHGFAKGSFKFRVVMWMFRGDYSLKAVADNECIELARRFLKRWRRFWLFVFGFAVIFAGSVVHSLWIAKPVASYGSGMMPWAVFLVGLVAGLLGGGMAVCAIVHFAEALVGLRNPRVARLMLTFHDALAREVQDDS